MPELRLAPARPIKAASELRAITLWTLLAFVVFAWGLNWVVMKIVVREITPVWAIALRSWIAVAVLAPAVALARQLIVPPRGDWPVVVVIALLHMVAFATLMTAGLTYVPAGRAIVLGYTTPLLVAPAAWVFLKEELPPRRGIGIGFGVLGLFLMFDPQQFDWRDLHALLGNSLIAGAAVCWSISIVYTRAHRWIATPFQLVLWQTLLAAIVLTAVAIAFEGWPQTALSPLALAALVYNGAIGTAVGYWAMAVVNKELPATATSLGLLATPLVGLALSTVLLGEATDTTLIASSLLILAGIALGSGSRA